MIIAHTHFVWSIQALAAEWVFRLEEEMILLRMHTLTTGEQPQGSIQRVPTPADKFCFSTIIIMSLNASPFNQLVNVII